MTQPELVAAAARHHSAPSALCLLTEDRCFSRWLLRVECRRRIDVDATVAVLERRVAERGSAPGFIRCDNGPELTANALRYWCRFSCAGSAYIEPGSPWQNPYVESFGSRARDELLSVELFSCLAGASADRGLAPGLQRARPHNHQLSKQVDR